MATEIAASVLRLCRLPRASSSAHAHGSAVCAKWDPSCSHRLVTLFSTGVLRMWDVVLDEYIDLALHLPGASAFAAGSSGRTPAKRSAVGVSMFDFLPWTPAPDAAVQLQRGPSIVFCTRQPRTVYVAELPATDSISAAAYPADVDFMAGARVYEYTTKLSSDACCIAAWAVAYPSACVVFAVAIGCADGSVEAWAGSTGLNPENVTGARTMRDASPAVVRTRSAVPHPRQSGSVEASTAPADLPGPQQRVVHSQTSRPAQAQHAARVTRLCAVPAADAWNGGGASLFCSASADGSVHLWRVAILATPSARAPTVIAGDIAGVVVEPLFPMPTDGSLITAAAAVAWPLCDSPGARRVEALTLPVTRLTGGGGGARQSGALEPPRGLRSLVALGTVDGAVSLFECIFGWDLSVGASTPPALPVVRVVGSLAPQPPEPITALALSPPLSPVDVGYSLAVADAAGILRVYRLQGTAGFDVDVPPSLNSWGTSPPLLAVLHGTARPSALNEGSTSTEDVILGLGAEAALLERLRELGADDQNDSEGAAREVPQHPMYARLAVRAPTSVSAAAMRSFQRAVISCGFHDQARGLGTEEHPAGSVAIGALMAVSGAGEVALWARGALPGDALATADNIDVLTPSTAAQGTLDQTSSVPEHSAPEQDSGLGGAMSASAPELVSSSTFAPLALKEQDAQHDDESASSGDDAEEPPQPLPLPPPPPVEQHADDRGEALVWPEPRNSRALPESGTERNPHNRNDELRVLRHTESSGLRVSETAAEQEERVRQQRPRAPGGPSALIDHRALALLAADAVRSLYLLSSPERSVTPASVTDSCVSNAYSAHNTSHCRRRHVRTSSATRATVAGPAIPPLTTAAIVVASGPQRSADPSVSESCESSQLCVDQRLAAKLSGPYMEPAFRNPARIASVILDASGVVEASAGDGGDQARFGYLPTSATADASHHLVAPTLGSAAALRAEILRLEGMRFDSEAATRTVLQKRAVSDHVVVETLIRRLRVHTAGHSVQADSPVPIDSDPSGRSPLQTGVQSASVSAAPAAPSRKIELEHGATIPSRNAAITRLLSDHRTSRKYATGSGTVSSGDVLMWQFRELRRSQRENRAVGAGPQPGAPASTSTGALGRVSRASQHSDTCSQRAAPSRKPALYAHLAAAGPGPGMGLIDFAPTDRHSRLPGPPPP